MEPSRIIVLYVQYYDCIVFYIYTRIIYTYLYVLSEPARADWPSRLAYSGSWALRNVDIKKYCLAILRFTYGNCCEHTIYILRNGA